MSENNSKDTKEKVDPQSKDDSFNLPVEKSPLFLYAALQIPLVILMVLGLYLMYQNFKD